MDEASGLVTSKKAKRKLVRGLVTIGLLALLLLGAVLTAGAATGDNLRSITVSPAPSCGSFTPLTVGIAFDGSELLVSCYYNNVITRVNPANGAVLGTYAISGLRNVGINAIAWDANHSQLWMATNYSDVYTATLNKAGGTGAATLAFTTVLPPPLDGLAYDGFDNTVWLSGDADYTVYHRSTTGGALGSFPVNLGGKGNSGIAVADATHLYLGNDGGGQVYIAGKDGTGISLFITLAGKRVEDLECDATTFAPQSVLWTKDAYDWELNAWQVPAGLCAEGGVSPAPSPVHIYLPFITASGS